ncbi:MULTISPECIES: hypothetical protein [Xanthomonas]|nr:hypothetical protein [Xanthomonas prunicola]
MSLQPTEDLKAFNECRWSAGLPSIEEYKQQLSEICKRPVK